jgi:hypothetical protein
MSYLPRHGRGAADCYGLFPGKNKKYDKKKLPRDRRGAPDELVPCRCCRCCRLPQGACSLCVCDLCVFTPHLCVGVCVGVCVCVCVCVYVCVLVSLSLARALSLCMCVWGEGGTEYRFRGRVRLAKERARLLRSPANPAKAQGVCARLRRCLYVCGVYICVSVSVWLSVCLSVCVGASCMCHGQFCVLALQGVSVVSVSSAVSVFSVRGIGSVWMFVSVVGCLLVW